MRRLHVMALGFFFSAPLFPCAVLAEPPAGLTLNRCFELARKQSESLQIQSGKITQIEERYRQMLGTVLPRLNFNASELFQDRSGGASTDGERPEAKFVFRQPIFSGFREFSTMSSYKADIRREDLLLKRAEKLLFLDVANAFYLSIQLETDLSNLQTLIDLMLDRIKELQTREQLGKSRQSEILSVESQLATLQSQKEQAKGNISIAREMLSFLIGQDASGLQLTDSDSEVKEAGDEARALEKVKQRLDIQALREDAESKRYKVKLAKGALLPTASFIGNYYAKREGSQGDVKWDALLSLDIPLFQGGSAAAQVREASSLLRESELNLIRQTRQARAEIRRAYLALKTSIAQTRTLEQAYKKADESYKLQVREYRFGLVNNLEVLQAMNAMQQAKSSFEKTSIQNKLNFLQLKVATDEMP